MKYLPVCLLLSVFIFSGCSKEEKTPPEEVVAASDYFFPGAVGNYWVYKRSTIFPGNDTTAVLYDTVRILSDSVVNGITYYEIESFFSGEYFFGDSAGTILTFGDSDTIRLGTTANTTLFSDTMGNGFIYSVYRTASTDTSISVPQGIHRCLEVIREVTYLQTTPPPSAPNPRPVHYYYAKDIGIVKHSVWYMNGPEIFVFELVDYHLN